MNENLIAELKAISEGTALYKDCSYGLLFIEGPDAAPYLQRMTSNEVQKLALGEGRYNALLDRKGMVLSLFYLIRISEQKFLAVIPASLLEKTESILTKSKFIEKVSIKNESESRRMLLLIGPKSEELLEQVYNSLPDKSNVAIILENDLYLWKEELFGSSVWNLSGPSDKIEEIKKKLEPQSVSLSDDTIRLMRMSVGFPEYGIDIDETHILLEAPVPQAHQRQKGCYPGQEVIERILAYGKGRTPRTLCVLRLEGEQSITPKTEIFSATGEKAGFVTSSLFHPLENKTIVLGYLDHKYVEGASRLTKEESPNLSQLKLLPPTSE